MTDPSLALQTTIRNRLIADATVTALVPATSIFDRGSRPEKFPCIILGEGQTAFGDVFDAYYDQAFADLHIWTAESDFETVKAIAGAVRDALKTGPWLVVDHICTSLVLISARYLRDPDGVHSHAVVSVKAILQGIA